MHCFTTRSIKTNNSVKAKKLNRVVHIVVPQKAEDDQQKMIMEQHALKAQQDATISKLLSSQHELNDE